MKKICKRFAIHGSPILVQPFGSGHINRTFLVVTSQARLYVLQEINRTVFHNVPGMMANLTAVCSHLRRADSDPRHSLNIVPALDGEAFLTDEEGRCWRMLDYVPGGVCLDQAESAEDFRQSGAAFGQFQTLLADFPADTLCETIPHFHDTPDRYRQLHEAIQENRAGRLDSVRPEVDALLAREQDAAHLMTLCAQGVLPLRVTHNDTKLNNVMLDETTREPLCVMDLDTVMPGLAANDFGDAIRFGASTAAEDELKLDRVSLSLDYYRAFAEGFLGACGDRLTAEEISSLPWGARLMTLECAVRFLTDHLNGDVYFHIARPDHNLDRCRTQLALVMDMERKWDDMNRIIHEIAGR